MNQIMNRWIELYEKSGVWEQYNPLNGKCKDYFFNFKPQERKGQECQHYLLIGLID